MAKKKREKQNRFIDFIIAILFTGGFAYSAISGLQMIGNDSTFFDNFMRYQDKYSWIMGQELSYQIPLLVLSVGVFILLFTMTKKKPSGYKDASAHGAYGNAVFSDLDDVRENGFIASSKESKWSEKDPLKSLSASEGIILGKEDDELVIIPPESDLDNRNVLVVGSSGSAKGQAFVINNIINNRTQTLVVTDPKGELYHQTSDIKRDQGYRVYQVDFLNLRGSRYNPLDYVTNDIEAIKIANAISINSAKDVKQDFFFNTAKDLLTGLIIYAKKNLDQPNIARTIKGLFNQVSEDEEFLINLCNQIGPEHPAYQYLRDASTSTGNTRTSILSSFAQQTNVFSLSDVGRLTEASDFSFHELQEHKSILYVKIPVKDNPVPALTATFFDQLISTLYTIGDQNYSKLKIPTIFLLDEFANLGKLNDYDNTLSTCRGYDLSLMTIIQDLAQLEEKYSKELSRTIVNNHDTTLFLRTKDIETAKYFEALAGDTTINFKTNSSSSGGGWLYILGFGTSNPSKSVNEQYVKKPLVSQSELLNMNPPDKCYVFMTGHVLELSKAYQSKLYRGFITGEKKEKVNGISTFPYVYPKNRKAYIEKFGFTPYVEDEKQEERQPIPLTKEETVKEAENVKKPVERKQSNNSMDSFVSSYLDEINKKEQKTVTASVQQNTEKVMQDRIQSVVDEFFITMQGGSVRPGTPPSITEPPKDIKISEEDQNTADRYSDDYSDRTIETSDPEAMNQLQMIAGVKNIKEKIEKTKDLEQQVKDDMALNKALMVSENKNNPVIPDDDTKNEVDDNSDDELPF